MRNQATSRRNIVLVGPMGSGKSHVGRLLAMRLGRDFVDVDARIETDAGMSIGAIFANEGEPGFRLRESRVLAETLAQDGQVVATGGGAVLEAGNRAAMHERGHVVYLQVESSEQLRRIAGDSGRPLLDVPDRGQRLAELQTLREPLYRVVADLLCETDNHTADEVAEALVTRLAQLEENSP